MVTIWFNAKKVCVFFFSFALETIHLNFCFAYKLILIFVPPIHLKFNKLFFFVFGCYCICFDRFDTQNDLYVECMMANGFPEYEKLIKIDAIFEWDYSFLKNKVDIFV